MPKLKDILDPEGQVFFWIKKQIYFEDINQVPTHHYGKMDKIFKTKPKIVAAEMIVIFTGDSAFLYSVIKWTVNVIKML